MRPAIRLYLVWLMILFMVILLSCAPRTTLPNAQSSPTDITGTRSIPDEFEKYTSDGLALSLSRPRNWYLHEVIEFSGGMIKLSTPIDNPSSQYWAPGEEANILVWKDFLKQGESFDEWVGRKIAAPNSLFADSQRRDIVVSDSNGKEFARQLPKPFYIWSAPFGIFVYNFQLNVASTALDKYATYLNLFKQIMATVRVDQTQLAKLSAVTPVPVGSTPGKPPNLLRPTTAPTLSTLNVVRPTSALPPAPILILTPTFTPFPVATLRPTGNCADPGAQLFFDDGYRPPNYFHIIGTAKAQNFDHYEVHFADRTDNPFWRGPLYVGTSQVDRGELMLWDLNTLSGWQWYIRLTVYLSDRTTIAPCIRWIHQGR